MTEPSRPAAQGTSGAVLRAAAVGDDAVGDDAVGDDAARGDAARGDAAGYDPAGYDPARDDVDAVDVALPENLTAPRQAREIARDALQRWRLPGLLDVVVLAVSELVTNAVRHGRPPVQMVLHLRRDTVRVDVHDAERGLPSTGLPDEDAESGRGAAIVADLADDSGVQQIPGDGKVVHVTFATGPPQSRG